MSRSPATLPVVIVPVGVDEDALDACLAALDAATPPGARVWLADDAQAGPRGLAVVERWLAGTRLQAAHTRRSASIGEAAHLADALRACGDADAVVLASDARPAPGWLEALADCLAKDATIATATPWSNAGETASWPLAGKVGPAGDLDRLGRACARLPATCPDLPAAVGHAVLLRGAACRSAGGLDTASYRSWYAALADLSMRLHGLGWRNVLCETAFVARADEGRPQDGEMPALAARWPAWHARIGEFLMHDPLHALRASLGEVLASMDSLPPQGDLFGFAPR